jgi:hypothetical protein
LVEVIGSETHFGAARRATDLREVDLKLAVKHPSAAGINVFLKEMTGLALAAPPGLAGFAGARAKPSPVVRLFSMEIPKREVQVTVDVEGERFTPDEGAGGTIAPVTPVEPPAADDGERRVPVPLEALAWGRSGDKGNNANIGIIARRPEFVPYIAEGLTAERVAGYFSHFLAGNGRVERFYLPGSHAFNFLLHNVLGGGGVASLRVDPQGKGYAQLLLAETVPLSRDLAAKFQLV